MLQVGHASSKHVWSENEVDPKKNSQNCIPVSSAFFCILNSKFGLFELFIHLVLCVRIKHEHLYLSLQHTNTYKFQEKNYVLESAEKRPRYELSGGDCRYFSQLYDEILTWSAASFIQPDVVPVDSVQDASHEGRHDKDHKHHQKHKGSLAQAERNESTEQCNFWHAAATHDFIRKGTTTTRLDAYGSKSVTRKHVPPVPSFH